VEATIPNLPRAPKHAIDGARKANRNAHDSSRERALVVGLDEQVQMVLLHGVVNDAKPRPRRSPKRPTDLVEHELFAKARQASGRAQRYVDRMGLLVLGTRPMGHAFSNSGSLSPRAAARSSARSKRKLLLSPSLHLNGLLIYNHPISP
jgi:hypothetical protein